MKKHVFTIALLAMAVAMPSTILLAQTPDTHQREIGLGVSGNSLNGSVIYKWRKSDNKFERLQGTFGNFSFQNNNNNKLYFTINTGVSIGVENRKAVGAKTTFYRGPQFSLGTSFSKTEKIKPTWNLSPRIGYILGIQHDFNDLLGLNMEIVPSAGVLLNKFSGQKIKYNINGSFASNASLNLMYKF
ncbi:MAG: hypothetical protein GC192_19765 [Bacteroidetes bacterium]|nr:hypothetical protein [Bacteroidota bacterium]